MSSDRCRPAAEITNEITNRLLPALSTVVWMIACHQPAAATDQQEHFFETSVRPILAEHCIGCHGEQEQSAGLRLDSREALLKGGENGAVFDADQPETSRLLAAIRYDGDLQMPPDDPLPPAQVALLTRWVQQGAYWPKSAAIRDARQLAAEQHWAFQPVALPPVPRPQGKAWVRSPIDAFVLSRLEAAELTPSAEADRRTLIRRAHYTLTGLPPSPQDVDRFVRDPDPQAYETLVDQLLDSPHYGEHWARHWLDVARYSDTKGYVYAREERFWLHAWVFRDWVVQALNDDMPYDRFLLLQLAADQVPDRDPDDLAAMGFLTLGRRFLGVERDIIDDRIDVVTRGTMGLTVGCARCHDHKYDPIPTADYYSLYGVFDSCRERIVRLGDQRGSDKFESELAKRQAALQEALTAARTEWSDRIRARIGDYLTAQTELGKYPPKGFDQIFGKDDMLPAFVRRWESYLREARRQDDPVFVPWHRFAVLSADTFAQQAVSQTEWLLSHAEAVNPLVLEVFSTPPGSFAEVISRYATLLQNIDAQWKRQLADAATAGHAAPQTFDDPAAEQLRRVLYGPQAPCEVPRESIVHIESFVDSGTCTNLWKLQGEIDRWLIQSSHEIPHAITLVDRPIPSQPRVFVRGNPAQPGDEVPRKFLSVLSQVAVDPFATGSGRRELADAIVDPANPLTSRVLVNRVWAHHFGAGLVTTPSDFGTRAAPPSHPQLLDWLSRDFVASGWRLKDLHRQILLSSTFRQNSLGPTEAVVLTRAQKQDPENRLLWRFTPRRLSFEELRDSLLAAGEDLDRTAGGKPADLFAKPYPQRRTLYGLVDRQFFPNTLRMFDFANPDLHIPQRPETTVPQQALFLMNHPFVLQRVRTLAALCGRQPTSEQQVGELYRRTLQREPTAGQRAAALQYLETSVTDDLIAESPTAADWQYGFGSYDEDAEAVPQWNALTHYTGDAWQGGPQWPDPTLGWVQLTASGGHPGNDRDHAAIRRWTAPAAMTVQIHAKLVHEAAPGDGIRAFVVSSRDGLLDQTAVHQQTHEFHSDPLQVEAGETIDFVVDIGEVLNSDQYLWNVTITPTAAADTFPTWNSEDDFTRRVTAPLTPLEQLAQILLSCNEFLFVD